MFSSQPKQDQWRCKLIYFSLSHAALDWEIRSPCSERISLIAIHLLEFLFSEFGSKRFDVLLSVGGFSRPFQPIDAFVEEKIPNASELFDYICINRLRYDDQDIISAIEPTPFDFLGKAVALEMICKKHGATLPEAVFVGEGYNDESVARSVGLSIAYPPHGEVIPAASRVEVEVDDLLKILPHVL